MLFEKLFWAALSSLVLKRDHNSQRKSANEAWAAAGNKLWNCLMSSISHWARIKRNEKCSLISMLISLKTFVERSHYIRLLWSWSWGEHIPWILCHCMQSNNFTANWINARSPIPSSIPTSSYKFYFNHDVELTLADGFLVRNNFGFVG